MGFIKRAFSDPHSDFKATPVATQQADYFTALQNAIQASAAPQATATNTGYQQGNLADILRDQIAGKGPNLAANQYQQALDKSIAGGASLIGSTRGINPGLAARLIAENTANQTQGAAATSAQLAGQQQLNATHELGQVLANQRAGDVEQANAATSRVGTLGGLQNSQNAGIVQNVLGAEQLNEDTQKANAGVSGQLGGGVIGGLASVGAAALAKGGVVPGKARVAGDSPENDTVPAMLSPGEVVLPRTAAKDGEAAKAFVEALKKRKAAAEPTSGGYARVLKAHENLKKRVADLAALCMGGKVAA
jgi:hypothetical protein